MTKPNQPKTETTVNDSHIVEQERHAADPLPTDEVVEKQESSLAIPEGCTVIPVEKLNDLMVAAAQAGVYRQLLQSATDELVTFRAKLELQAQMNRAAQLD